MKIYIFISVFIFSSYYAQKISFTGTTKPFPYSEEILDKGFQNIYYNLKFVKDVKKNQKIKETICILRIGKKYSMFSDYNSIKTDSIGKKLNDKTELSVKEFNEYFTFPVLWHNHLLKSFSERKTIVQDLVMRTYQYEEQQPEIKWLLEDGTKEILGYICKRASAKFRGRKYTAWYAKDIPINNGPYIFEGLPGLIMEIEDSKNHYHFTAIAIDKKINKIYIRNEKHILHVSREQFRNLQKSYHDNPGFFQEQAYDANGNSININWKSKPYNPIELE